MGAALLCVLLQKGGILDNARDSLSPVYGISSNRQPRWSQSFMIFQDFLSHLIIVVASRNEEDPALPNFPGTSSIPPN